MQRKPDLGDRCKLVCRGCFHPKSLDWCNGNLTWAIVARLDMIKSSKVNYSRCNGNLTWAIVARPPLALELARRAQVQRKPDLGDRCK